MKPLVGENNFLNKKWNLIYIVWTKKFRTKSLSTNYRLYQSCIGHSKDYLDHYFIAYWKNLYSFIVFGICSYFQIRRINIMKHHLTQFDTELNININDFTVYIGYNEKIS